MMTNFSFKYIAYLIIHGFYVLRVLHICPLFVNRVIFLVLTELPFVAVVLNLVRLNINK